MTPSLDALIVSQPVDYGVAIHVRQLTEAAVAAGHRVAVACPGQDRGPLADWVRRAGAEHHRLDMARRPSPRDALDILALRRLSKGKDVVHLHSSKAAALGRVAALTIGGPERPAVVVTPHYWSWMVGGPWAPLYRSVERSLAHRCDTFVALSEVEAAEGRRVLGRSIPVRVIANGVDLDRFSPEGPSATREPSDPLVVCVGRLSHQKGQDIAIRALARLGDRGVRLRLVGDESDAGERRRLAELARGLGVGDRVEWVGAVEDTAPHYRAADVVVVPSRWDGMSLALLEAIATGAAIVATLVSGSDALGDAGLRVAPDDPAALADALEGLLRDPARRRAFGAAASRRAAAFGLDAAMRRNLEVWSEVVREPGAVVAAVPSSPGEVT